MLANARSKVKTGLANLSFIFAQAGGILGSVSMLGAWLTKIANIGPWWTPDVLFAVSLVVCLHDWAEGDGTPNRRAVYTAMMWPSFLVASLTGESGANLFKAIGAIDKATASQWKSGFKNWVDLPGDLEYAFTVFSLIMIVAAITYSQLFVKKNKSVGAVAGGGSPIGARRAAR